MSELATLVSAYWKNVRYGSRDSLWASEEVDQRVLANPSEVIALLVSLAAGAPDDAALAHLGAGPVEDLLVYHGSSAVFDGVEAAARRNASFRKALRCAWFDDELPATVVTRLRAFGLPY